VHPKQSSEAVFEIIHPSIPQPSQSWMISLSAHVQASVLSCTYQSLQLAATVGDCLPLFALRISDHRVFRSIFTAILSDFTYDPTQVKSKASTLKMSKLEMKKESESGRISYVNIDTLLSAGPSNPRDLILRMLSLCSVKSYFQVFKYAWDAAFGNALSCNASSARRLLPFLHVLGSQCIFSAGESLSPNRSTNGATFRWSSRRTTDTITMMEKEFFQLDTISQCRAYFASREIGTSEGVTSAPLEEAVK
jgi:hypothetical protein